MSKPDQFAKANLDKWEREKKAHDHIRDVITSSMKKHGHGKDGMKAHLQEMLAHDEIPDFLKKQMQHALSKIEHHERIVQAAVDRKT